MSAELTEYTGGAAVGAARSAAQGSARDTRTLNFNAGIVEWDELPAATRMADSGKPGTAIAESIDTFTAHALKVDGVPHQLRTAWRAYPDQIFLARLIRPLSVGQDGRQRPSGQWLHHTDETRRVTTEPVKTVGRLAADVAQGGTVPTSRDGAADVASMPADVALSVLPGAVRGTVVRAVPQPAVWLGGLTRITRGPLAIPISNEISLLRMDDVRAVVVLATRALPAHLHGADPGVATAALAQATWDVTQITYTFRKVATQLEAPKARRIGWRR